MRIRKIRTSLFEMLSLVANDANSGSLAELNDKLAKLERSRRENLKATAAALQNGREHRRPRPEAPAGYLATVERFAP